MKRNFLAVSALITVLTSGVAFAQSQASDQDNQMANVEAIMQRSHQTQQQNRVSAAQQKAAEKAGANFMQSIIANSKSDAKQQFVGPGSTAAAVQQSAQQPAIVGASSNPQVQQLESQLSQLNQANKMFQRQTDQRIDVLNQEHNALQGKLTQLGQVLSILNQEVSQLNEQITNAQKQLSANLTPAQQQQKSAALGSSFTKSIETQSTTQYVLYAILVLLIIIIMMLIPRRGGAKVQAVTESGAGGGTVAANELSENDTSDEYDFMNSDEAIPAKLDLARAYMAMEDYKSAKKVLEQVKAAGNKEQKAEAQKMFDKIPRN